MQIENTGPRFSLEGMREASRKSWQALHEIARRIEPGMTEKDGIAIAKDVFKEMGAGNYWHRAIVRMEQDTLLKFSDPMTPDLKLTENGIYFIDIGPVFDGYEGDVGATFTTGSDPLKKKCAENARKLFEIVAAEWRSSGKTGRELYDFASQQARGLGWELNLDVAGHRLGDFPHAAYAKGAGKMGSKDFKPSPGVWVLEIQIRHPSEPFGAFHEDVLI